MNNVMWWRDISLDVLSGAKEMVCHSSLVDPIRLDPDIHSSQQVAIPEMAATNRQIKSAIVWLGSDHVSPLESAAFVGRIWPMTS